MDVDPMIMAYARLARQSALRSQLGDPNLSLIDIGLRRYRGQLEDELTIRFHVRRKLSPIQLQLAAEQGYTRPVPRTIDVGRLTFRTDVIKGDYHHELWGWGGNRPRAPRNDNAKRTDPLYGGLSISDPYRNTYGTLGGPVIDRTTGVRMILSNFHVLAADWAARAGQYIYQPGRLDGGAFADSVATLARHTMSLNIDAAVATLLPNGRPLINYQLGLGPVTGAGRAQLGMNVVKSGATTQVTNGVVTGVEGTPVRIRYGSQIRAIGHVMTIESQTGAGSVSAGGDSGSWWLDQDTMQAVGLHFAGQFDPDSALGIDMPTVLVALNVDIDTSRAPTQAAAGRAWAAPAGRRGGTFAARQPVAVPDEEEALVPR